MDIFIRYILYRKIDRDNPSIFKNHISNVLEANIQMENLYELNILEVNYIIVPPFTCEVSESYETFIFNDIMSHFKHGEFIYITPINKDEYIVLAVLSTNFSVSYDILDSTIIISFDKISTKKNKQQHFTSLNQITWKYIY